MINVAIADDSAFLRQLLTDVLESSKKIKVAAALKNGKEALEFVKAHPVDLLILDCEMPVMNGLEALRRVMQEKPMPVMMFSSLTTEGAAVTIKALEYGAVDFLLKPSSLTSGLSEVADALIRKVELITLRSRLSVVRSPKEKIVQARSFELSGLPKKEIGIIAMGSSTGGVQATMQVIPKLPEDTPPVVWVQHMPEHFTKSFANRLAGLSKMKVKEADDGDIVARGNVYLGRGGVQMFLAKEGGKLRIKFGSTEKVNGFCPSCNVLFDSVAQYFTTNALGVILTGMGNDGTEGLKKMHAKGAYVLGQDEATSTVYGMPRTAFEAGVVQVQLPIDKMAAGIMRVCGV